MGVKPNRQGWCGPQRSEDTALSILLQGEGSRNSFPLLTILRSGFADPSVNTCCLVLQ